MKNNISIADALRVLAKAKPSDISDAISDLDGIDEILEVIDGSRTSLATMGLKVAERCESDASDDLKDARRELDENPEAASNHVKDALYEHATAWYVEALTAKDLHSHPWSEYEEAMDSCIVSYTTSAERELLKPTDYEYIKDSFLECMLDLN